MFSCQYARDVAEELSLFCERHGEFLAGCDSWALLSDVLQDIRSVGDYYQALEDDAIRSSAPSDYEREKYP